MRVACLTGYFLNLLFFFGFSETADVPVNGRRQLESQLI